MGFGFNLFCMFILLPVLVILLVLWLIKPKKVFLKAIGWIFIGVFSLITVSGILRTLTGKKVLSKNDYYGTYVIDRNIIPGKQADWQYNHYRFEIKENDSVYFYVTDKNRVQKIYKGKISTTKAYKSERLKLHMQQRTHHVLATNPTIYRSAWSFTLVFNSSKFSNMFFTKGTWEKL